MAEGGQKRDPVTHRTKAQKARDNRKQQKNNPTRKRGGVLRKKARRAMTRAGKVHKGDGKDVHHKKPVRSGGKSSRANLAVTSRKKNRSNNGSKRRR